MERLTIADLADVGGSLVLDEQGRATEPWALIDLDQVPSSRAVRDAAVTAAGQTGRVLIGVTESTASPDALVLAEHLAFSLMPSTRAGVPKELVAVPDVSQALERCDDSLRRCPTAALTFIGLLRLTSRLPVSEGLVAESLAYSMLLAGSEFGQWLSSRPDKQASPAPEQELVRLRRTGGQLFVELNRPDRHNAFSHDLRDALVDALGLAQLDSSIEVVNLSGSGPSFCSGGDLQEFGTAADVCVAHLVRQSHNAGAVLHGLPQHVRAVVHGACIGAGVQLPAFASRIEARNDAYFQLPEVRMGLIPGAGGTVSITRRIGRWRTAFLGLTGQPIDVDTALSWGLVDARVGDGPPTSPEALTSRIAVTSATEIG